MPYLTNRYIFNLAPSRVPFFIRPIANMIFNALNDMLVKPNLQANVDYVSTLDLPDVETLTKTLTDQRRPREVSLAVVRWGTQSNVGRLYDALPNGGICFPSLVEHGDLAG